VSPAASPDVTPDPHELEYRRRLQAALGPGFELRDLIGRGGFGGVYAAWDRSLERDVAVKALRHDLFPTPVVLERFQREAKALAQLRHPHVLPVYEVGSGDGVAYMVMPFIRGETLGDMLRRGHRIPMAEAVRITIEVARALDAAHRAGIVHRDVKPDNILIEGPDRHAVLSDFGVAKAGASELTGTGIAIGSPQYMSPEQAAAEKEIDARSDIYSLGVVAYEMLAGRRPHEAGSLQRLLVLQLTTDPVPIARLEPGLPAQVDAAVMRALAREPEARWASAADLATALTGPLPAARPERESWLARRGLILFALNLTGLYVVIASMVLQNVGAQPAIVAMNLFRNPFMMVLRMVVVVLLAELVFDVVRAPRGTRLTAAFGQPRWWQPWYPRFLRSRDSAWDRMPAGIKALRTVLWLVLAALPLAAPLTAFVPQLGAIAAGAGLAVPLPARLAFAAADFARQAPLYGALIIIAAGVAWYSLTRRVRVLDVVRLLLTWCTAAWETPAGRALQVSGLPGSRR